MTVMCDVLTVGAGHGGAQAAVALRQLGFTGTIAVVGEEPGLPYERSPLSKEYMSREKTFQRILIRPAAFLNHCDVRMILGRRVVAVVRADTLLPPPMAPQPAMAC